MVSTSSDRHRTTVNKPSLICPPGTVIWQASSNCASRLSRRIGGGLRLASSMVSISRQACPAVCSRRVRLPRHPRQLSLHPMESDYRRPQDTSQLQCERFRVTINSLIRCPNGKSRLRELAHFVASKGGQNEPQTLFTRGNHQHPAGSRSSDVPRPADGRGRCWAGYLGTELLLLWTALPLQGMLI